MRLVNVASRASISLVPPVEFVGREEGFTIFGVVYRSSWNPLWSLNQPIAVQLYGAVGEVLKAELTGDRVQVQEARRMLHRDMFHGFLVWMIIILIMALIHLLRLMIQH